VTDHFAQDEPHALAITRNIFANLNLARPGGVAPASAAASARTIAAPAAAACGANANATPSASGGAAASAAPQQQAAGWEEPLYDAAELRGAVPPDSRTPWDVRSVLGRILDGSRFEEFKSNYGKTLVTGACVVRVLVCVCLCACVLVFAFVLVCACLHACSNSAGRSLRPKFYHYGRSGHKRAFACAHHPR
jgi:hypothetical protein